MSTSSIAMRVIHGVAYCPSFFARYLRGVQEGGKKERSADQEVTDLSKFLWFADNTTCKLENVLVMEHNHHSISE